MLAGSGKPALFPNGAEARLACSRPSSLLCEAQPDKR